MNQNGQPIMFMHNEMVFHGKPLVNGIAQGNAYLLKRVDLERLQNETQTVDLVSSELAQLDYAIIKSKNQISHLMHNSPRGAEEPSFPIFEASLLLLHDPNFISAIRETIERTSLYSETVLAKEIVRLRESVATGADELLAKSLVTMQDLYYRVLYNLLPAGESRIASLLKIPVGSILIADRLTPAEVAVIPMDKIVGILTEESSPNSHASIMVQTLGIPVIIDFPGIGSLLDVSTNVMIDAYRGLAFLNPTHLTIDECQHVKARHTVSDTEIAPVADKSTIVSSDGMVIHLACNASTLRDILHARSSGIRDIGLFRSEIRYLSTIVLPTLEQDNAHYVGIMSVAGLERITIRLLDLGGDKLPLYLQMADESDPQLGSRGIRFLLSRPELMKKQLRALFLADRSIEIRLLLPFITTNDDLTQTLQIIDEIRRELNLTNTALPIGIMVEVPSVAYSIAKFLPRVDFVCLGTNDLAQYFFAANREQDDVQMYNRFSHPSFLSLLKNVIDSCEKQKKHLTVCGEMAADPIGCTLLVAMGATNLSIQPDSIHHVHHAISKLNVTAIQRELPRLLELESADDVEKGLHVLGF